MLVAHQRMCFFLKFNLILKKIYIYFRTIFYRPAPAAGGAGGGDEGGGDE